MNADGTGNITLPEFLILLEHCADIKDCNVESFNVAHAKRMSNRTHEDDLRAAFIMLDESGGGFVSVPNLCQKLRNYGLANADKFLMRLAVDPDGCIVTWVGRPQGPLAPCSQLPRVLEHLHAVADWDGGGSSGVFYGCIPLGA